MLTSVVEKDILIGEFSQKFVTISSTCLTLLSRERLFVYILSSFALFVF